MKKLLAIAFALIATSALAQDGPNHSMPVFGGAGFSGFRAVGPCTTAQILGWPSGAAADPACGALPAGAFPALTGDVTTSAGSTVTTIANNAVTNAKAAQMPANTFKGNNTASTANALDLTIAQTKTALGVFVLVTDPAFGALCNGTGNDATAIQAAIDSLPANGGTVLFPATNCRITTGLTIGNGNSTPTSSTKQGIILRGVANPNDTTTTGYTLSTGPMITWAGGASAVITVNGPIQGWGIQNLKIDCASITSSTGIMVHAGVYGDNRNLSIFNCAAGISTDSYPNRNTMHNGWRNIFIQVPVINFAIGVILQGDGVGATSNTSFEHYENLTIYLPATQTTFALRLVGTDSDQFYNIHIAGGSATAAGITFDYAGTGVSGQWPASNMFYGVEPSSVGTSYALNGTPGAGAKPNIIYGHEETNGAVVPVINNLAVYGSNAIVVNPGGNNASTNLLGAWSAFTPALACGTATFTVNSARALVVGKTTHLKIDFTISVIGTCTTPVTFTIPNTAQATGVLPGLDISTSTAAAGCKLAAASATATCLANTGANFAAQNYIFTGIYENQ